MKKQLFTFSFCLTTLFAQAQTNENASFEANVYALQNMASNGSPTYLVDWTTTSDGISAKEYKNIVASHITTLNIDATAISASVNSISVYANGKEAIAGQLTINGSSVTTPTGDSPSIYATNGQSDVVMVSGSDKTCTVYLLPTILKSGVKVTVHTEDGKFYSQDFTDINVGESNNLVFTNTTANNLWMSTIPGNTYFSFVSTPGAHDAATSGVTSYTTMSKCQDMDIEGLLNAGVRCFDIRPGYCYTTTISAENLYIYHGQVNTNVLYKDAMKMFADFLKENPSEALSIVMVKENCKPTLGGSKWTDRSSEMWTVVNAVQEQYKSYMKTLDHSYYTLDDFRGKICYVNRTGTSVPYTTQITNWPDNATVSDYSCTVGLCKANVQDAYNSNGTKKQNAIKDMLQLSSGNTQYKNMHYNYCSSANYPANYAKATNPVITNYLNDGSIDGPTGYVLADYIGSGNNGGAALLSAIINQNYRYVYNGRSASKYTTDVELAVSDDKYATFISPFDAELPTGVKAYIVDGVGEDNELIMTEQSAVKANTPVVLYSETPVTETIIGVSLAEADAYSVGALTGVYSPAEITTGYVLQNGEKGVKFYSVSEETPITVPANKAYLTTSTSEAKVLNFPAATAINALTTGTVEAIYNANGVKQNKLQKGMNIIVVNGKTCKVVVK